MLNANRNTIMFFLPIKQGYRITVTERFPILETEKVQYNIVPVMKIIIISHKNNVKVTWRN